LRSVLVLSLPWIFLTSVPPRSLLAAAMAAVSFLVFAAAADDEPCMRPYVACGVTAAEVAGGRSLLARNY
jgi:hypothetical protein